MNISHSTRGLNITVQLHQALRALLDIDGDTWCKMELVERFALRKTQGDTTLYWLLSFCYGPGASFHNDYPHLLDILKRDWLITGLVSSNFLEVYYLEEDRSKASETASSNETVEFCAAEGCGNTALGHGILQHFRGCNKVLYCGRGKFL